MARSPELLWSMPVDGDELATLAVDDRGDLAVSTSARRVESRPAGFDAMESLGSSTPDGMEYTNLYAHRSYGIDDRGRITWEHGELRIVREIPEGWAALTDRHDLVLVDQAGVTTRRGRLRGDSWRICGWRDGNPIVSSERDSTWVEPYVYSVRDRKLQHADETGRHLGSVDLARAPFDDECRRDPPPPGVPDAFVFPSQLHLSFDRKHEALIATHRLHMAWVASITLDGEVSWVRLVDHACCNSACIVGDRIVHTSSCGRKVTVLAGDGRELASLRPPQVLDTIPDGRGGLCVRALDGLHGFDANLEPTWSLSTNGIPYVTARDDRLYLVAGAPGALVVMRFDR